MVKPTHYEKTTIIWLFIFGILFIGLFFTNPRLFPSFSKEIEYDLISETSDSSIVVMEINSTEITLEVARTHSKRATGLMNRYELGQDNGMLFVFEQSALLNFYMKNTFIPLDIIFLDEDLNIVTIHENTRPNQVTEQYMPIEPSLFVIEMNAGWALENNVDVGDEFKIIDIR